MTPFVFLSFLLLPPILILIAFKSSKKTKLPPSPPKLPLIGNLHQLGRQPHLALHALSKKHGKLISLQLGHVPTLVVTSPEIAMEIMKTQDSIFANRPSFDIAKKILYGPKDIGFSPYGEHWRQAKKICVLHLLSNKKVESLCEIREEEVAHVVDMITRMSSKGPVNMSDILITHAYDTVCRVALGKKYSGQGGENKIWKLSRESSALLGAFNVRDFFPELGWLNWLTGKDARVERHFQEWDGFLNQAIQEHQEGNNDLLTTSCWLFVSSYLSTCCRMCLEVAQRHRSSSWSGRWLKAVIKEVMRLHPPAPLLMPRESMEETTIQGYTIPERFLSSDVDFKGHDFHYIPFGSGRRICPEGMQPQELDMAEEFGLAVSMKNQLFLHAKHKRQEESYYIDISYGLLIPPKNLPHKWISYFITKTKCRYMEHKNRKHPKAIV